MTIKISYIKPTSSHNDIYILVCQLSSLKIIVRGIDPNSVIHN